MTALHKAKKPLHSKNPTQIWTKLAQTPTETQTSSISIISSQPSIEQIASSDGAAKITGSTQGSNKLHTSSYTAVLITPVQMQLNGAALPSDTTSDSVAVNPSASLSSSPSTTSTNSLIGSPELQSSPQHSPLATDTGHRLTPDRDSSSWQQTSVTCSWRLQHTHISLSVLLLPITECPPCPVHGVHCSHYPRHPATTPGEETPLLLRRIPERTQLSSESLLSSFPNTPCEFLLRCGTAETRVGTV